MNAYFDAIRRYFQFRGRSTRNQFWLFTLVLIVVSFVAMMIDGSVGRPASSPGLLFSLVYIVHLIPALTLSVRRLHDIDRSGWWVWLGLVPLVGQVVLLVWACTASTLGANRFGPSSSVESDTLGQRPPMAPQSGFAGADLDRLEKLGALRASAAIDDTEFARLKADVLNRGDEVRP